MKTATIDGAAITLRANGRTQDGRTEFHYHIRLPDGTTYANTDLASGVGGGSEDSGMESLLCFLNAAGESYQDDGMDGENAGLFPEAISAWAARNQDELAMLQEEFEN